MCELGHNIQKVKSLEDFKSSLQDYIYIYIFLHRKMKPIPAKFTVCLLDLLLKNSISNYSIKHYLYAICKLKNNLVSIFLWNSHMVVCFFFPYFLLEGTGQKQWAKSNKLMVLQKIIFYSYHWTGNKRSMTFSTLTCPSSPNSNLLGVSKQ